QVSIAHNGNLTNARELREYFEQQGQIFCSSTDTEVIAKVLTEALRQSNAMEDAVLSCMKNLKGSYSVVLLVNGVLFAFRDPLGIKPLCIGRTPKGYLIAS